MLQNTVYSKLLPFSTVLMDSWYATNKLMQYIDNLGSIGTGADAGAVVGAGAGVGAGVGAETAMVGNFKRLNTQAATPPPSPLQPLKVQASAALT